MSDLDMRHASDGQLLRYADGELRAREAAQVRRHLEACWQCRAELTELQEIVGRCVSYRRDVLQRALPPPPQPWSDIYRKFDDIELSRARVSWGNWFRSFRLPGQWIPVAVTVALLCGVFVRFRETPSVHASELLKKAVAAAERRPQRPRRVQIRTSKHRITRVLDGPRQPAASPETSKEIQSLFELANYSWEDPLSARSFDEWREQLDNKRDEVVVVDEERRIRTTTETGELSEATLTLKGEELQPREGTLRFRNAEFVEITELPHPLDPAPPMVAAGDPAPSAAPSITAPSMPPARATAADELHVVAKLHQLGADLGEPVEVTRDGGRVLVTGMGLGPDRQRQIEEALQTLPRVVVRFAEPLAEPLPAGPAPPPVTSSLSPSSGLEKALGQRSSELLDASDALMARIYALRGLAQRFPEHQENQLSAAERLMLARLRDEHAAALRARTAELYGLLSPVLGREAGRAAPARPPALPSGWQPAAEDLFRRARLLERLLAAALGGAPVDAPQGELAPSLMIAADDLRAAAEAYEDSVEER
jgi:hypothetical protein